MIFFWDERKAAEMKRAAEAFQLGGCKDNVLLQIEKGLLLTCSVSELVTVGGYQIPYPPKLLVGSGLPAKAVCRSISFVAYEIAFAGKPAPTGSPTFNEQRTDRFPRMKPSAKVRGFQFLLRSKAWHDRTE
ncbi:hypothetical protein [Pseudomonas fluorescens]|uniref:hypothetical protein n=1 Tax=Pseudomonas fluorescens TaxID=294 RepID=UPI001241D9CC|nr:hypothetical protein [Pseudomonas fluorescens]